MQRAGSPSWRLTVDDAQTLHLALYVRDRAALLVTDAPDVPPPLASRPTVGPLPDEWERVTAGAQWLPWWRSLVAAERTARAAYAALDDRPPRERMRAVQGVRDATFDPPEFATLSGSPALRGHVLARYEEAIRTSNDGSGGHPERRAFAWATIRDVVEAVAVERNVPVGALAATASVLPVRGRWTHVTAPGNGLCSIEVARDDPAARVFLRALFTSALDA